jgi:hypothetical protein
MKNSNLNSGKVLSSYNFINQDSVALQCTPDGKWPNGYDLWLYDISMGRGNGYGQYKLCVSVQFNSEMHNFRKHSTDSELWDELHSDDLTDERKEEILTSIFESVMQDNEGKIMDIVEEILAEEE